MANEFKIKKGLIVAGASGGTVVDIQGSQGQLFSVTDNLSGSIFAVSDISGVPILDVNSSGLSTFDGTLRLTGAYYDKDNLPGTSGQVLSSTVTGTSWVTSSGGATSLNGLSDVLIDGSSSYLVNVPTTLSGNPANNLVIGNSAGNAITTGQRNVILGSNAATSLTTSLQNVIIGHSAGINMTTGSNLGRNVLIGDSSGNSLTTGYGHVIIGYRAGESISGTNQDVVIGYEAARTTAGTAGVIIGYRAMYQSSGGQRSTVIGNRSLYSTTGSFAEHTAFGYNTLYSQTTGRLNTAIGYQALYSGTVFIDNTAVGYKAGVNVSGSGNTLIGANCGINLTSGSNNTCIGNDSAASSGVANNEFTLGNSSISTLRCAVTSITSLSDERDKAEIKDLTYGLDFIDSLQPREFVWNNRPEIKLEQVLDENNNEVFDENQEVVYEEVQFYSSNKGKKDFGFVAQEIQELDDDTLRLVYDSNPDKLEISYGKLVPILVKAIQELKAEIEALR
tara:strand:- start:144 stop:1658 length:1515 start_codon:yes stop_codon:yes gene_type:complete